MTRVELSTPVALGHHCCIQLFIDPRLRRTQADGGIKLEVDTPTASTMYISTSTTLSHKSGIMRSSLTALDVSALAISLYEMRHTITVYEAYSTEIGAAAVKPLRLDASTGFSST